MWQHVGGWWLGGLQLAGHRGPESVLTEMFAQLKHHLLRHITEGCQQQSESMESMNGRCKYFRIIICLSRNTSALFAFLLLATKHLRWAISILVPSLTFDGVERDTLFLFNPATLSSQATTSTPFRLDDECVNSLTHSTLTVTVSVEQHLDEIVMGVPGLIP